MFCPRCGQQQLATDARFCSRCGFHLTATRDLLWSNGLVTLGAAANQPAGGPAPPPAGLSPRRKGTRLGAKLLFAGGVIIPVAILLSIIADDPGPLLLPLILLFLGLTRWSYARLFEDDTPLPTVTQPPSLGVGPAPAYLPPPVNRPGAELPRTGAKTGEVESPPSVTEPTTKLLEK